MARTSEAVLKCILATLPRSVPAVNRTGTTWIVFGVGSVGLMVRDSRSRVGEVGYWLNYTASGRGLTSRALELLSSWALSDGQMVRLELLIETENTASRKVAERTGYSLEGVMRQKVFHRGAQRDVAMYARTL